MLCNSDFSERLGGWESVIWVLSVEGHALDTEPSTISWFSVESHRSGYRIIHDLMVQRGKSCSEYRTIHDFTVLRGKSCSEYRTIHDFTVQRGRSLLWISNHPRYHGSAWKVTALNIEPSTISRFSVEGHALYIEPSTISWFSVEGPRSG